MNTSYSNQARSLEQQRQKLETLLSSQPYTSAYAPARLGDFINRWSRSFVKWLIGSQDPHITQRRHGNQTFWQVYDPVTRETLLFDDEASIRTWIDQRYYQ
jgi:hypothetical protein